MTDTVVYIAAKFPKLSETFVYREVLSLREAGLEVPVVSVRPPEDEVEDPQVVALRDGVIPVYGSGNLALLKDMMLEFLGHPLRSLCLLGHGGKLCFTSADLKGPGAKAKVLVQCFASLALARRLRPLQPRLLHAHMAHVPTTFAMFTARQLEIPYSFTGHAADLFRDRSLLLPKLQTAAFVHCISVWHQQYYQELFSRPEEDYPLVRCGVDPEAFAAPPRSGGTVKILAVGRLVRKKGFDLLLEALATPALQNKNWELELVGDGPEMENLQAQAAAHPAAEKITLSGAAPNEVVREKMKTADLFALPCRVDRQGDKDGIPVVLMEAMAAGCVVISGDIPSIRELIHDRKNGRLFPSEDLPALTAILAEVIDSPETRKTFADAALTRIHEAFTVAGNTQRILDNLKQRNLRTL
ncbi:glycosyltransferase family 4 protein [Kiritimatiellaeota bacterium B1221]|nr:glycosyltransferase family 4 protein [Kiritimatiellaeota bacterium B1221]